MLGSGHSLGGPWAQWLLGSQAGLTFRARGRRGRPSVPGLCQESFCGNTLQASIPAQVGEDKDNEELGSLC